MLDQNYVVDDILTNADRFLENRIGKFKTWHIAFFVSAGILIASKYLLFIVSCNLEMSKPHILGVKPIYKTT